MEGKKKKEKEKNRTVNTREREAKTCVYGIWSSNEKHRVSGHVFIMLKSKDPEAIRRRLQIIIHIFSIFPFGSFSADVNIYHRRLAEPVMCRGHRLWRLFSRHVSSRDTLRLHMLLLFFFFPCLSPGLQYSRWRLSIYHYWYHSCCWVSFCHFYMVKKIEINLLALFFQHNTCPYKDTGPQ